MFRKAIDKDPNYAEAYNNLAVISMKQKKFDEASELLDKLIEFSPDYANAYLNRGIIASEVKKDNARALENFNKYLELGGPRSPEVRKWVNELEGGANQ